MTGLESILTPPADEQLAKKSENKLTQTVNNVVSFNAIKNHLIELFYPHDTPIKSLLDRRLKWFMMNPTYTNRDREVPRKKNSARISLNYYKRTKKFGF
jgi:hypothetical protein